MHYGIMLSQALAVCSVRFSFHMAADSDTELDQLDASSVYIIGGIVDHNRCVLMQGRGLG